jgi:putative effector of murein hydrolase LrgA (UPF0299 family)
MELLRCKARLSVLWLTMAIGTATAWILSVMMPGTIEEIMSGEMGELPLGEGMEGIILLYAVFFLIPMVVAILCLTLNVSANRWLSFVLGIIGGLWMVFEIVGQITMGETGFIGMWLMMVAGLVISAYIAYFAWKLPEAEA